MIDKLHVTQNIIDSINRFSKYRRHPSFSKAEKREIFTQEVLNLCIKNNYIYNIEEESIIKAILVIEKSIWDSKHFGIEMAKMYFFADSNISVDSLVELLKEAIIDLKKDNIKHISIDVDIDNYLILNLLISVGFQVMDIKRTYLGNIIGKNPAYEKMLHRVRPYQATDLAAIEKILEHTKYETKFTRDARLDANKSQDVYKYWFYKLIEQSHTTSQVVVFENKEGVVACGAIGEFDFHQLGVNKKMRSGSVYACLPQGIGAYGTVLYRLTMDAIASHGLVETTVSLNNTSAVRVVEGMRPNHTITTLAMRMLL